MSGPAAFMSYAEFNERTDKGTISDLREALTSEVASKNGQPFHIYQSKYDLRSGDDWAVEIAVHSRRQR